MALIQEETKNRTELVAVLAELTNIKAEDLVRTEELGKALDFAGGLEIFKKTLNLFNELRQCKLENIPDTVLKQLKSQASDALTRFKQIKEFSPQTLSNPSVIRDNLINNLQGQYNAGYFSNVAPVIAYLNQKRMDFGALEKDARNVTDSLKRYEKEFIAEKERIVKDIESTLDKVRRAAAQVGVAQHAIHFENEASEHEKQGKLWFRAAVALTVITILWGALSFVILSSTDTAQIIQYTVAKLMILSVLSYGIFWCAKNYSAHQHNYVVNKHRQNSLNTFEAFVKAAGDDADTKNAVLLEATRSIFAAHPSGYVQNDSESQNKVIEIISGASLSARK